MRVRDRNDQPPMRETLLAAFIAISLLAAACGGDGGYTQEEVDQLVAQAVEEAIAEQDARISEEEAQQQIEEGLAQASLAAAVEECPAFPEYITVDEGGLVMEGEGEESSGAPVSTLFCVLDALDTPESVLTRIGNTNSTMGLVEGSWGDYSGTWSYHPDNGLFIHIVAVE